MDPSDDELARRITHVSKQVVWNIYKWPLLVGLAIAGFSVFMFFAILAASILGTWIRGHP